MTTSQQMAQMQPSETFPGKDKGLEHRKLMRALSLENVLFDDNLPACRDSPDGDAIPVSEAARMLFVSSSCVIRLIGKVKLRSRRKANYARSCGEVMYLRTKRRGQQMRRRFSMRRRKTETRRVYGADAFDVFNRSESTSGAEERHPVRVSCSRILLCAPTIPPAASLPDGAWRNSKRQLPQALAVVLRVFVGEFSLQVRAGTVPIP
jgi:hypothetical protein